jgi:hypothetical protein
VIGRLVLCCALLACAEANAAGKIATLKLLQRVRVAERVGKKAPGTAHVVIHGDFVYVAGASKLYCLKRDAAGRLTPQRSTDTGRRITLASSGDGLYGVVQGGLAWYEVADDGTLTEKGRVKRPPSRGMVACEGVVIAPDRNALYLRTNKPGSVAWFKLAKDRAATPGGVIKGKGLGDSSKASGGSAMVLSPDGRHLYSTSQTDHAVAVIDVKPDGTPVYREAVDLAALAEKPTEGPGWNRGFPWPGLFLTPDGRQLYVVLWRYGGRGRNCVGVFDRDPKTGALTFKAQVAGLSAPKGGAIVFTPDGRAAWLAALSHPVTRLRRDPATSALTVTGRVPNTRGPDRRGPRVYDNAFDPARGHLYFADVYGEVFVVNTKQITD